MKLNCRKQIATLVVGLLVASGAMAQYVWLDDHGVKQYSDVAPPSNVPQNHILKQPGHAKAVSSDADAAPADAAATAGGASASASTKAPMTTAEKNADFNKRKLEQAEKDKKAAEESKRQEAKPENCKHAKQYLDSLKSGMRITSTDANGERSYLSDDNRAKEEQRAQNALNDNDCN